MAIIADHLVNVCTTGAINYLYEMMEDVYVHHVNGEVFLDNTDSPNTIARIRMNEVFESGFKGFTEKELEDGVDLEHKNQTLENFCDSLHALAMGIQNAITSAGHSIEIAEYGDQSDDSYGPDYTSDQERERHWSLGDYTLKTKTANTDGTG